MALQKNEKTSLSVPGLDPGRSIQTRVRRQDGLPKLSLSSVSTADERKVLGEKVSVRWGRLADSDVVSCSTL